MAGGHLPDGHLPDGYLADGFLPEESDDPVVPTMSAFFPEGMFPDGHFPDGHFPETEGGEPGEPITVVVGLASETDSTFTLTVVKVRGVGLSTESESTFSLAKRKVKLLSFSREREKALRLQNAGSTGGGIATVIGVRSWRVSGRTSFLR